MEKKKALIAMSGGVDSSVCALLMQQEGYDCMGVTMKLHDATSEGSMCSAKDAEDAALVAAHLGMPHCVADYSECFEEEVIRPFVQAYSDGITPNPCLECNRHLKFTKLLALMEQEGYDCLVTGHYVRIRYDAERGRHLLLRGEDETRDQSYVLYMLTPAQLARIRFPLGELEKSEVRKLAEEHALPIAHKKESQDICFVPDKDYAAFIRRYTGKEAERGAFLDEAGNRLGEHRGIIHYTIGQHKGLGLSTEIPLYVTRICPKENTVILGKNEDLFSSALIADNVNLIDCDDLKIPRRVTAKIRYRHREQPATAWQSEDGLLHVEFDTPQRAITCGQAVVLYDGDVVVGGGRISHLSFAKER